MSNYSSLNRPVDIHVLGTVTIPASSPANAKYVMSFATDPTLPDVSYQYIRSFASEYILLKRVLVPASTNLGGFDGYLTFSVDGIDQQIVLGLMSLTVPTLYNPVVYKNVLTVDPNQTLSVYFIPTSTQTVAATVSIEFVYARVPKSFKGKVS